MIESSFRDDDVFDVAIVGGGASGVLVAIHLLHGRTTPLRIAIIEPRAVLGQGAAYSTAYPEHLLNVTAARMSAFDDDPDHFVRHLLMQQAADPRPDAEPAIRSRFAPRRNYGRYLLHTLEAQPFSETLRRIEGEVVDIEETGDACTLRLYSGESIHAHQVVLAIGNNPRPVPLPAAAVHGDPAIASAWDYASVHAIDAEADVCILGSGLSMVDAAISLASQGHRGRITVLSRHGLMPLPHAATGSQDGEVDELLGLNVRQRMHELRRRAVEALRMGQPWQWVMDRLRHHGQALWQHLDAVEQRRFLRHAARFWDIHRHRIAPDVAAELQRLRASGQLVVDAGRLASITADGPSHIRVRYRRRHAAREHGMEVELAVNAVINATGVETGIDRMRNPLVAALRKRGTIAPGAHGIGFATDADGGLIDVEGNASPRLLTLGAARIGQLWESIAIPELRGQAQRIARRVASGCEPLPDSRRA